MYPNPQSPTKRGLGLGVGGLLPGAGAASAVAHSMLAPSTNIKQARNPEHFAGAAPIDKRVTGLSICMKNTALGALIASSGTKFPAFRLSNPAIPFSEIAVYGIG